MPVHPGTQEVPPIKEESHFGRYTARKNYRAEHQGTPTRIMKYWGDFSKGEEKAFWNNRIKSILLDETRQVYAIIWESQSPKAVFEHALKPIHMSLFEQTSTTEIDCIPASGRSVIGKRAIARLEQTTIFPPVQRWRFGFLSHWESNGIFKGSVRKGN